MTAAQALATSPGCSSVAQAECPSELYRRFCMCRSRRARFRDHHDVARRLDISPREPQHLPYETFDAIADDGAADSSAHRDAEPAARTQARRRQHHEMLRMMPSSFALN